MKIYKYAVLFFLGCATHALKAQEKPYNSMIFRSQIFDKSHLPVKNENLSVEVELFTKDKVWYSEKQQINTNNEGLAFIQVGKGTSISGKFNEVPFSNQEVSLRIKYKVLNTNGAATGEYVQLQSTDLYAVPYAFHALTAESVTGNNQVFGAVNSDSTGDSNSTLASKGNTWSVYGNRDIGMRNGFLGTVDAAPLNIKTNNQTRINITPDGKINFLGDINLGNNNILTVTNLTTQNLTTNNANVNNLIAQTEVVESSTQSIDPYTGALIVKGGTGIKMNLNVGENLSVYQDTNLLGNLKVDGTSKFTNKADFDKSVKINDATESNTLNEGSFVTAGGASVAKNLNVGGNTNISGNMNALQNLAVGKNVKVNGDANAANKDEGAVIIESGGLGVEKDMVAGGSIRANTNIISDNNLTVSNTANLNTLNVEGNTTIKGTTKIDNNTPSSASTDGALVVHGGVGIGENLNVAKNAKIDGVLTSNNLAVNNSLQINGTADAVNQDSGALIVTEGGLGVDKSIYAGKNITAKESITANGNVNVLQNTNVGQNLSVAANTTTSTLTVNNTATISGITKIDNATSSYNPLSGALVVDGGLGVKENINVGNNLNVKNDTHLDGNLYTNKLSTFNDLAAFNKQVEIKSTVDEDNNKALEVDGGAIVGKRLHVRSTLNQPYGDFTNAALKVDGGAIINGNLSVLGKVFAQNATVNTLTPLSVDTYTYYSNPYQQPLLNNQGYGPDNLIDSYALKVNAVDQGIAIKVNKHAESNYGAAYGSVNSAEATTGNNFISFWNKDGKMVGRIQGQNLSELINKNGDYANFVRAKSIEEATLPLKIAFRAYEEAIEILEKKKSEKSQETSNGLQPGGVTGGTSNGGTIVGGGCSQASQAQLLKSNIELLTAAKYADKIVTMTQEITLAGERIDRFSGLLQGLENTVGVMYASSAGDYAEYLELMNYNDFHKITPAQVVGVKGGKISLNTNESDKIMVISTNPAVVGKAPSKEDEKKFKAVAFMGQVPVFVLNKAKVGDYIIPSGNNDGYAVAKSKDMMEIDDYKNIIGIAWEETNSSKLINVVVGINTNDVVGVIKEQQNKIADLESRLIKIENYLSKNTDAAFTSNQFDHNLEMVNNDSEWTIHKDLTMSDSFNKIVASIIQNLKDQNINTLKNKDLYIENEVNNYFAGIFFAKEVNQKLSSEEQKFLNQCFKFIVNQVKVNLL